MLGMVLTHLLILTPAASVEQPLPPEHYSAH